MVLVFFTLAFETKRGTIVVLLAIGFPVHKISPFFVPYHRRLDCFITGQDRTMVEDVAKNEIDFQWLGFKGSGYFPRWCGKNTDGDPGPRRSG